MTSILGCQWTKCDLRLGGAAASQMLLLTVQVRKGSSGESHTFRRVLGGEVTEATYIHKLLARTSHVMTTPPRCSRKTWGSAQVEWTVAWQDRAHETSSGGTQEAVKNVSGHRGGGGHRTTAMWETGHESGG